MSNNLGMGVMIGMLSGNAETVEAVKNALGKTISRVWLDEQADRLKFTFSDNTTLDLWDDGQSCCEHRYMRTDDNLNDYTGHTLENILIKDAPGIVGEYGDEHEIQFLEIITNKGHFQMSNHNEHNGYYGGFFIRAK